MVHRLDMSTSGILITAKSAEAHKKLQEQFASRKVQKRYVALLEGTPSAKQGEINLPLRVDLDNRPFQIVDDEHGKPARTIYKVVGSENGKTRVHFFPITGRTHQLRVHAAHHLGLGCPIVGDDLYGQIGERLHLHAEYLKIRHPMTDRLLTFHTDPDF